MTDRPTRRYRKHPRIERPDPCMTFDQVAAELGVSAQAVRQTELRALKNLRQGLEELGFTAADILD